ncbi:hypothetical protein ACT009_04915 [Sphingomonas sp. Tas61C01]|uniref:hypothetical protein n=1 Tax=Sphingomonas sp. Tas61C01 TaxID=3458297 RepID=UPI00403EB193
MALCSGTATAQVAPPMGSSPTPGAGLNYDASAHDKATDYSALDDVNNARRAKRVQQVDAIGSVGGGAVAATSGDLLPGSHIFDKRGQMLGDVERVDALSVTVASGAGRVAVPAEAFGKNKRGLMLELTKKQFDELVKSTVPTK